MKASKRGATSHSLDRSGRRRDRAARFVVETLESREMLTGGMLAAVNQYGLPSQFLLSPGGSVYYNSINTSTGKWNGWVALGISLGGERISAGTFLDSATTQPYVDLLNSSGDVYFNSLQSSGTFSGFSPVSVGAGLTQISTETLPIYNAPFVFATNTRGDVFYTQRSSTGAWTGLSPVGIGVGARSLAAGAVQLNASPLSFEPYLFMLNGAGNVYFTERSVSGSWTPWSAVGVGVGGRSISSIVLDNTPMVTMVNGANNVYTNQATGPGTWFGWSPVSETGVGAQVATGTVANFTPWTLMVNGAGALATSYGGAGAWTTWQNLGAAPPAAAYAITANPGNAPFAFIVGIDGYDYWNYQNQFATWNGWIKIDVAPTS